MLQYWKTIFSGSDAASFSRYATLLTVLTGCWSVIRVVVANHALPDAGSLAGMGAFMCSPYAVRKAADAFGKSDSP